MVLGKIERLRNKLHATIEKYGLESAQVQKISKELDELINEYIKRQKIYPEGNIMINEYNNAIEKLEKLTAEFGEFPSIEKWNKYAKEKVLLNSESIKYISGLNWHELRDFILYKIDQKKF